jgi:hypothetical protein
MKTVNLPNYHRGLCSHLHQHLTQLTTTSELIIKPISFISKTCRLSLSDNNTPTPKTHTVKTSVAAEFTKEEIIYCILSNKVTRAKDPLGLRI